jgi:Cellulose binding domain
MSIKKNNSKIKTKISVILILISILTSINLDSINAKALANSIFNNFTYGVSVEQEAIPSDINLVAGPWILNDWQPYNSSWLNKFNYAENTTKTPYLYTYIAAGKARADWGLQDCNVGAEYTKTLCYNGANYIRSKKDAINQAYVNTANQIKILYGSQKEIVLHLEPDFYQYSSSSQNGGGINNSEAASAMNQWSSSIKNILPNATLVLDVSPWNRDIQGWSAGFQNFDYAGMVGKRFSPYGDGSVANGIDGKTYAQISAQTGKKLIVDDSHGAGGWWLPFNYDWANQIVVQDRKKDGIAAVILPPNNNNALANLVKSTVSTTKSIPSVISSSSISKSSSNSSDISSSSVNSSSFSISSATSISSSVKNISQNQVALAPITDNKIIISNSSLIATPNSSDIVKSSSSSLSAVSSQSLQVSTSVSSAQSSLILQSTSISNPNIKTCSKKSLDVTLTKTDSWQGGYNTSIKVKNNGTTDIFYWSIIVNPTSDQSIISSWNMTRYGNQFDPKYNWNMTVKPGQEINAGGFTTQFKTNDTLPAVSCNF